MFISGEKSSQPLSYHKTESFIYKEWGLFDILIKDVTSCNISYTNTMGSIWNERLETDFLGSYCGKKED